MPFEDQLKPVHNPLNQALQKHLLDDLGLEPSHLTASVKSIDFFLRPLVLEEFKEAWALIDPDKNPGLLSAEYLCDATQYETLLSFVNDLKAKWTTELEHRGPEIVGVEDCLTLYAKVINLKNPTTVLNDGKKLARQKKLELLYPALLAANKRVRDQLNDQKFQKQVLVYNQYKSQFQSLREFLLRLLPTADLLRDGQTKQLQTLIADIKTNRVVWKPITDEFPEIADELGNVLSCYETALHDWLHANAARRALLTTHKAHIATDTSSGFYDLDNALARSILDIDPYGEQHIKKNATGNHTVTAVKAKDGGPGSHFKKNKAIGPIGPGAEAVMTAWFFCVFTQEEDKNNRRLTAPTILAKLSNVMCVDREKSPKDALLEFEQKLLAGMLPEDVLKENPYLDKSLVKKYVKHVVQISQTMGTMSLHALLELRRKFLWAHSLFQSNNQLGDFPSLLDGSFINRFKEENKQNEKNAWCHKDMTDEELFYQFILLMRQTGKYFYGFTKEKIEQPGAEKNLLLLNDFKAAINNLPRDEVLASLILATRWPQLIDGQAISDLGDLTKLFKYLPKLFPGKTYSEYHNKLDQILNLVDDATFTRLFLAKLISGPTDDKSDNFMVDFEYDASGNVMRIFIIGIDNDEALCDPITKNTQGDHFPGVKNIFNFFPSMQKQLDPKFVEYFLNQSAEALFLQWLVPLLGQDRRFNRTLHLNIIARNDRIDESSKNKNKLLDIPLRLDHEFTKLMFYKIQKIQELIRNNRTMTHQHLFEVMEPVLAEFYKTLAVKVHKDPNKFFNDPKESVGAMYGKDGIANSVEKVLTAEQLAKKVFVFLPGSQGFKPIREVLQYYTNNERKEERRTESLEKFIEYFVGMMNKNKKFPSCLAERSVVLSLLQLISYEPKFIEQLCQLKPFAVTVDQLITQLQLPGSLSDSAVLATVSEFMYLQPQLIHTVGVTNAWLQNTILVPAFLRMASVAPEIMTKLNTSVDNLIALLNLQDPAAITALLELISLQPQLIKQITAIPRHNLLWYAIHYVNAAAVRELLKAGADINYVYADGNTALHYAVRLESPSLAVLEELLKASNRETNKPDSNGFTPVFYIKKPSADLLGLLEQYGEQLDYENRDQIPLYKALADQNYDLFFELARNPVAARKADPKKILSFVDDCVAYCQQTSDLTWRSLLPKFQAARASLIKLNPAIKRLAFLNLFTTEYLPQSGVYPPDYALFRGVLSGNRIFTKEAFDQIFIDAEGGGKMPARSNLDGARDVSAVRERNDPNAHMIAHVKFIPQCPWNEMLMGYLAELLGFDDCVALSEYAAVRVGDKRNVPVLISQHAKGVNLQDVLKNADRVREFNDKLDSASFTRLILLLMLIAQQDGKADNFILQPFVNEKGESVFKLVAIDNELLLGEELIIDENGQHVVRVESAPYMLTKMFDKLDREVCKEFLSLNPMQILNNLLGRLAQTQNAAKDLLNPEDRERLAEADTLLDPEIFSERQIIALTKRFEAMQKALSENPQITGFQLLQETAPPVATKVAEAFETFPDPVNIDNRCACAWQHEVKRAEIPQHSAVKKEAAPISSTQDDEAQKAAQLATALAAKQANRARAQRVTAVVFAKIIAANRASTLKTTTAVSTNTIENQKNINAAQACDVLRAIDLEQRTLESIVKNILAGNIQSFLTANESIRAKIFQILTSTNFFTHLLEGLPAESLRQTTSAFAGLKPQALADITANLDAIIRKFVSDDCKEKFQDSIFDYLKPEIQNSIQASFISIIKDSKDISLTSLIIPKCISITVEVLIKILKNSPQLKHLDISGCTQFNDKEKAGLFKKKKDDNDKVRLLEAIAKYCPNLEKLTLGNLNWESIGSAECPLNLSRLRRLDASNCPELTFVGLNAPCLETIKIDDAPRLTVINGKFPKLNGLSLKRSNLPENINSIIHQAPDLLRAPDRMFLDKKPWVSSRIRCAAKFGNIWTEPMAREIAQTPGSLMTSGIGNADFVALMKMEPMQNIESIALSGTKVGWQALLPCLDSSNGIKKITSTDFSKLKLGSGAPPQNGNEDKNKKSKDKKDKYNDKITAVTLNGNGELLAGNTGVKFLSLDEVGKPRKPITKDDPKSPSISAIKVLPNGDIVTATGKKLNLFQKLAGETEYKLANTIEKHGKNITGLEYFPSIDTLVTVSEDKTIRFWKGLSPTTKKPTLELLDLKSPIHAIKRLNDTEFVVGCENGELVVCDVTRWTHAQPINTHGHRGLIMAMEVVAPDVVAIGGVDFRKAEDNKEYKTITLVDLKTKKSLMRIDAHQSMITCIASLSEGQYFASGSNNGEVIIWDMMTGKAVHTFPAPEEDKQSAVTGIKLFGANRVVITKANGDVIEQRFDNKIIELGLIKAYQGSIGVETKRLKPNPAAPTVYSLTVSFPKPESADSVDTDPVTEAFLKQFRLAVENMVGNHKIGNADVITYTQSLPNREITFETTFEGKFFAMLSVVQKLVPRLAAVKENPSQVYAHTYGGAQAVAQKIPAAFDTWQGAGALKKPAAAPQLLANVPMPQTASDSLPQNHSNPSGIFNRPRSNLIASAMPPVPQPGNVLSKTSPRVVPHLVPVGAGGNSGGF